MTLSSGLDFIGMGAFPASAAYETESSALFARFSTDPGTTRKDAINTCIASLKSAGVWTKLDALWVLAAHESASALLNWKGATNNLTVNGSMTFTADQGYVAAAASSANYLSGSVNVNALSSYSLNAGHISVWSRSTTSNINPPFAVNPDDDVKIWPSLSGDDFYSRVNDSAGSVTVADAQGMSLGNRSGATARQAYRNGSAVGSYGSVATTSLPASVVVLCRSNISQQIAMASIGGSLDSTEQLAFYNAINTLKTAVGW